MINYGHGDCSVQLWLSVRTTTSHEIWFSMKNTNTGMLRTHLWHIYFEKRGNLNVGYRMPTKLHCRNFILSNKHYASWSVV